MENYNQNGFVIYMQRVLYIDYKKIVKSFKHLKIVSYKRQKAMQLFICMYYPQCEECSINKNVNENFAKVTLSMRNCNTVWKT